MPIQHLKTQSLPRHASSDVCVRMSSEEESLGHGRDLALSMEQHPAAVIAKYIAEMPQDLESGRHSSNSSGSGGSIGCRLGKFARYRMKVKHGSESTPQKRCRQALVEAEEENKSNQLRNLPQTKCDGTPKRRRRFQRQQRTVGNPVDALEPVLEEDVKNVRILFRGSLPGHADLGLVLMSSSAKPVVRWG
jgi:hypothetical protein